MRRKVIIIPGSKTKEVPVVQPALNLVYKALGVQPGPDDEWIENLSASFREDGNEVDSFSWSGGITRKSIEPAAEELSAIIDQQDDFDQLVLFGKSLGGIVGEIATTISKRPADQLIYVATPHSLPQTKLPQRTRLVNIFSREDHYVKLANLVLNFGHSTELVQGARNIRIEGLKHSDFNVDSSIVCRGRIMGLYQLYNDLVASRSTSAQPTLQYA